ncbi:hypothetical protein TrVGV298_002086 [Trichoderma virens]|nr:hypothetical protein TrVGV298_002086 [Trichoderma virens]
MNAKYASRSAVALHASAPKASPSILYLEHPFSWTRRQSPLFTLTVPQDHITMIPSVQRLHSILGKSGQQSAPPDRKMARTACPQQIGTTRLRYFQNCRKSECGREPNSGGPTLAASPRQNTDALGSRLATFNVAETYRKSGHDTVAHLKQQSLTVTVMSYA